jgi:hypothetical protein
MSQSATVAVYASHDEADAAIKSLQKAGKFLVLAQGTPEEVNRAKGLLAALKPVTVAVHTT